MTLFDMGVPVNPSAAHAELIATFKQAQADAAHKFGLIKAAAQKGPKAVQVAAETAAKAAKRRDSYAKKLDTLGVSLKD
jgi:enoyl-CoA hydratase/carnithine racemase